MTKLSTDFFMSVYVIIYFHFSSPWLLRGRWLPCTVPTRRSYLNARSQIWPNGIGHVFTEGLRFDGMLQVGHDDVIKWKHLQAALQAICAGNSPIPGEFPAQRPVTRSFDVFFDLRLNKRFSKQSWAWWFETLSSPLWRHCNATRKLPQDLWKTCRTFRIPSSIQSNKTTIKSSIFSQTMNKVCIASSACLLLA